MKDKGTEYLKIRTVLQTPAKQFFKFPESLPSITFHCYMKYLLYTAMSYPGGQTEQ